MSTPFNPLSKMTLVDLSSLEDRPLDTASTLFFLHRVDKFTLISAQNFQENAPCIHEVATQ